MNDDTPSADLTNIPPDKLALLAQLGGEVPETDPPPEVEPIPPAVVEPKPEPPAWYDKKVSPPDALRTEQGDYLIQRGMLTTVFGEWGSGKSWLAAILAAQWQAGGDLAYWTDYETQAGVLAERLRALGMDDQALDDNFSYGASLTDYAYLPVDFDDLADSLVVVDAFTGLMADRGASHGAQNDTDAVAAAYRTLRAYTELGATVVVLDHANRSGEPLGSQAKLSGSDSAFLLRKVTPFDRETDGYSLLVSLKSRDGYPAGRPVARLVHSDGQITLESVGSVASATRGTSKASGCIDCGKPVPRPDRNARCKSCSNRQNHQKPGSFGR